MLGKRSGGAFISNRCSPNATVEDPIITFPGVKDETAQTGQVQTPE
jgi:hypothetical protein